MINDFFIFITENEFNNQKQVDVLFLVYLSSCTTKEKNSMKTDNSIILLNSIESQ